MRVAPKKTKSGADLSEVKTGTYKAHLSGVREFANNYGPRVGFEFTLDGGDFDGKKVMRSTAPSLSKESKLAEVIEGLMGRSLSEEELEQGVELLDLVGKSCEVLVIVERNRSGKPFSNVVKVYQP